MPDSHDKPVGIEIKDKFTELYDLIKKIPNLKVGIKNGLVEELSDVYQDIIETIDENLT